MSSEQIEDIMSAISDMGVNIVESDEDVQEEAEQETDDEVDVSAGTGSVSNPAVEKKKETVDRTDDPVRMYLREMGEGRSEERRVGNECVRRLRSRGCAYK